MRFVLTKQNPLRLVTKCLAQSTSSVKRQVASRLDNYSKVEETWEGVSERCSFLDTAE